MSIIITLNDLYEFKRCSLRYKLTKIDKLSNTLNGQDGLREAINSTINYFYYQLQDGKYISFAEVKEKFSSIWYGNMDLYEIKLNGDQKKRTKELEAIRMLQQLYSREQRTEADIIAVNLDFRIPFSQDFVVKDTIPLIRESSQGYEIVNFKTGKQKYD